MPSDIPVSIEDVTQRLSAVRSLQRWRSAKFEWKSVEDFLAADRLGHGIHSILVGELMLDLFFAPVPGTPMLVFFHGNCPRAEGFFLPVFSGTNVTANLKTTQLVPSDPTLACDAQLQLSWHAGHASVALQQLLPRILDKARRCAEASRLIFWGGSGGGFAALYYASFFPDSVAFVWNPQTDILRYLAADVAAYASAAFGIESLEAAARRLPAAICTNLLERYRSTPGNRILWLQNANDWHVAEHMLPFMEGLDGGTARESVEHIVRSRSEGFFGPQRYLYMGQDWGSNHEGPGKELVARILAFLVAHDGDLELLRRCGSLDAVELWVDPQSLYEATVATRLDDVGADWPPLTTAQCEALDRDRLILATGREIALSDAGEPDWDESFESDAASNIASLYSLEVVGALLSRFERSGEVHHLARATELAGSFFRHVELPAHWQAVATHRGGAPGRATMAIRTRVLIQCIQVLRRAGDVVGACSGLLRQSVHWLHRHALWLFDDRHHARDRQGVMMDLALIECGLQFQGLPALQQALLSKADERLCGTLAAAPALDGPGDASRLAQDDTILRLVAEVERRMREAGFAGRFLERAPSIVGSARPSGAAVLMSGAR